MSLQTSSTEKEHQEKNQTLLMFDWDNVFYSLFQQFGPDKMNLEERFKKLIQWVQHEIGELWGGYGFVFAPEHLTAYHRDLCKANNLKIWICPKEEADGKARDTVDETIIWYGREMMDHPRVGSICLVSGDEDYVPLLEKAHEKGVKIALAIPTLGAVSTNKKILKLINHSQKSGKRMVLRLDTL